MAVKYLDVAKKAIEDVFSDTSVSRSKTKEQLTELQDLIQQKIDALGDVTAEPVDFADRIPLKKVGDDPIAPPSQEGEVKDNG